MVRLLWLIIAALFFISPASAQFRRGNFGADAFSYTAPASALAYTGIGDLSVPGTVVAYWGGDCYTKTGTYDIFKVDNSTTTNTTIVTCTPNGVYSVVGGGDSLATIESDCGGSNITACTVTYAYDQTSSNSCTSATCDVQQTTAANQPYLIYSNGTNCGGINAGLFCFAYNHGTTDSLLSVNLSSAIAQPINVACIGRIGSGNQLLFQTTSSGIQLDVNTDYYAFAGTYITNGSAVSSSNWAEFFASFDGATASATQLNNNTATTTSQGANTVTSSDHLEFGAQADYWQGFIGACFVSDTTVFGATGISNMYSTWKSRWGAGIP